MHPGDKDLSREEDYRDYEERDLEEGWPYDDAAGETSRKTKNRPYGGTAANFDSETSKGFTVTGVDETGEQERQAEQLLPGTRGLENADDLEERVMDALSEVEGVDADSIDVRAEGSTITLEGDVDDHETARRVERRALTVGGVTKVRNNLNIIGVDANLPDD